MKHLLFSFLSSILLLSNYTFIQYATLPFPKDKIDLDKYLTLEYEKQLKSREIILQNSSIYLEEILKKTFSSKYECCTYNFKKHSSYMDLTAFLYLMKFENESIVLKYLDDYQNFHNENDHHKKWKHCIKTIPKKDCRGSLYKNRINSFPYILRDTSSFESSKSLLGNIAWDISEEEECASLLNYLQSDLDWRKRMIKSLMIQLNAFGGIDEDFDYDIFDLMYHIPDSLTSQYAYDQVMENDFIHENLQEIIYDRGTGNAKEKYNRHLGGGIVYSEKQLDSLRKRIQEIKKCTACSWCDDLLNRIN